MDKLLDSFIQGANAFDVDGVLALFEADAVIDDASVGDAFVGTDRIRVYLERFFVGYKTTTRLLSLAPLDDFTAIAHVDFTGDFGHETGTLRIRTSASDLIERIDADLDRPPPNTLNCARQGANTGNGCTSQASAIPGKTS